MHWSLRVMPRLGKLPRAAHVAFSHRMVSRRILAGGTASNMEPMLSASRRRRNSLMENQARLTPEIEQPEQPTQRLLPALDRPSTVLLLIEKVALDPRADVEKLERMMAMYERLKAKEAELAYNEAKGRILKKLAGIKIVKNRSVLNEIDNAKTPPGTHAAFKYAPLEEIDKHLRPLLADEDMDLSYSDEPGEDGSILIRGRLKHL